MAEVRLHHPVKAAGPAYSFGKRLNISHSGELPGPGSYDSPEKLNQPIGGKIMGVRRNAPFHNRDVPGPGQYDSAADLYKGPAFSMSKRIEHERVNSLPGPAAYDKSTIREGPKYSFGSRHREAKSMSNIGPGSYDIKKQEIKGYQFRARRPYQKISDSPGPGEYHTNRTTDGPSYGFGNKRKAISSNVSPGPGAYDAKPTNEGHGPTLRSRRQRPLMMSDIPGPGQYDLDPTYRGGAFTERINESSQSSQKILLKDAPATSFGIGNRGQKLATDVPGPGSYSVKNTSSPSFSLRGRLRNYSRDHIPGPGSYELKQIIGDAPLISLKGKLKISSVNDSPGPGAYDNHEISKITPVQPSYGMGKPSRRYQSSQRNVPGPGQYDTAAKTEAPQWGFGGASRMPRPKAADTRKFYNIPAAIPIAPSYLVTDQNKEKVQQNMGKYK